MVSVVEFHSFRKEMTWRSECAQDDGTWDALATCHVDAALPPNDMVRSPICAAVHAISAAVDAISTTVDATNTRKGELWCLTSQLRLVWSS